MAKISYTNQNLNQLEYEENNEYFVIGSDSVQRFHVFGL